MGDSGDEIKQFPGVWGEGTGGDVGRPRIGRSETRKTAPPGPAGGFDWLSLT